MRGGEREKEGERGGQIKGRAREREREKISRFRRRRIIEPSWKKEDRKGQINIF